MGEQCSGDDECANKAVSGYVDVVCGSQNKCVFAEDEEREVSARSVNRARQAKRAAKEEVSTMSLGVAK